jgi:hypothetical protein
MGALGLMVMQEIGFDIISMWKPAIRFAVLALLMLFAVLAFLYWKRKRSRG